MQLYRDRNTKPRKDTENELSANNGCVKFLPLNFVPSFSNASYIALRWSARGFLVFAIDMLLRWSKEVSL